MAYEIEWSSAALRQLRKLERGIRARIVRRTEELAEDPRRGATKLRGIPAYRVRVGDYRIVYEIQDDRFIIVVIAVGNRREVYSRGR